VKPFIPQVLPIQGISWDSLIPLIGAANRSIAHYDGVLYGVPNPAVLLSPLTTQEAVLSSRIEGTVATLGEVLKFEAGEIPDVEARRIDMLEIINYRHALRYAEKALKNRPFNLNLLLELHSILLDSVRGQDKGRGSFRKIQNWVGEPGTPIEQAKFVPPDPLLVPSALDSWEKYYHAEEPDPLVQLAIIHAQFEIIHPFIDGNGRIGRILIPLFLYEKELLSRPMFYLSAYLEKHHDEYVSGLRALGRNTDAWQGWIAFFLRAIDEQARENASTARSIMDLYEKLKVNVIDLTHSQYAIPLLDQIFQRPIFKSTDVDLSGDQSPSRQAVSHLLRVLRDNGILKVVREGRGRQAQVLVFAGLLNLCEGKEVF
jgi:Fic family protein